LYQCRNRTRTFNIETTRERKENLKIMLKLQGNVTFKLFSCLIFLNFGTLSESAVPPHTTQNLKKSSLSSKIPCSGHGILVKGSSDFDALCSPFDKDALGALSESLCGKSSAAKADQCKCHQCYEGPTCSQLVKNCAVDSRVAELTLTKQWFDENMGDISIPNALLQRHMSYLGNSRLFFSQHYKNNANGSEPSRSRISEHLNSTIRLLHRTVGNVKNEQNYNLVIGSGGVQMINAAMFAMSKKIERERQKRLAGDSWRTRKKIRGSYYAKTPCYSHFKIFAQNRMTDMKWLHDEKDVYSFANGNDGNKISNFSTAMIEIVTSPNNPDGRRAVPAFQENPGMLIHDHVYHWPTILNPEQDTIELENEEIMIFSLSKLTGHAASRIGWALVKDAQVAKDMASFVWLQSTHASVEAQYSAIKIIRSILKSVQQPLTNERNDAKDKNFFEFARNELLNRWTSVESVLRSPSSAIELVGKRGSPCLWLRCRDDTSGGETCASRFSRVGIVAEDGESFGADNNHTRICIASDRSSFDLILERMKNLVNGHLDGTSKWTCADCQDHYVH
jgi:L-tryptophan--pyruvate aminotransferase